MKRFPSITLNPQLDDLQKRFKTWRKSNKPRTRIPVRFWDAAVKAAGHCGVHRTARALHLDYYALKKRFEACGVVQTAVPFIELSPAVSEPTAECTIELEARNGAKMRIHLKGTGTPDLNALSSLFWRTRQ